MSERLTIDSVETLEDGICIHFRGPDGEHTGKPLLLSWAEALKLAVRVFQHGVYRTDRAYLNAQIYEQTKEALSDVEERANSLVDTGNSPSYTAGMKRAVALIREKVGLWAKGI